MDERSILIAVHGRLLAADVRCPSDPRGVVILADGGGAVRRSPAGRFLARVLEGAGLATVLLDLRTADEQAVEGWTQDHVPDLELLAGRLAAARSWVSYDDELGGLPIGYFGFGVAGAAALRAAAREPDEIFALVISGGRPDRAALALPDVRAPTLLVADADDAAAIELHRQARGFLRCVCELAEIPGATARDVDPQALAELAAEGTGWFVRFVDPELEAPVQPGSEPPPATT